MLYLHALGALDLSDATGSSLDAILAQPKRSLLLAYLATAVPRGYQRRDILIALFWPELDAERARAALRKALHFLRADVGDAIATRGDEIGVDSSLLGCDVVDFENAVEAGRLEDAMALYRGEFLPGVFAKDAPGVERWVHDQRARLSATAVRSAWTLAERLASVDERGSLAWASRAIALAPDAESSVRRFMRHLDGIGARLAALRVYEEFAGSYARAYDGDTVSPEMQSLYQHMRNEPAAAVERALPPAATQSPPATRLATPVQSRSRWTSRQRLVTTALVLAGATLASVAISVWNRTPAQAAVGPAGGRLRIAVMPFAVRGERVEYLREGMVDLLSITLQDAGEIRTVDPVALLDEYQESAPNGNDIERARDIARRFHATSFVMGTVVNAQGRLEARVSLFETNGRSVEPIVVASGAAAESELSALVDNLSRDVVAGLLDSRETRLDQLAAKTTRSLPALKDYLRGVKAMRTGQYAEATGAFRNAITADTTFALAYYGLSMALGWASGGGDHEATLMAAKAVEFAHGLSPHDSLLLTGHLYAYRGLSREAEQAYRQLLAQSPSDVDAWHELGDVLFHDSGMSGRSMTEAAEAFTKVADVEPMRISAMTHLARIAAIKRDSVALDSLERMALAMSSPDPRLREIVWLRTFVSGDVAAREKAVEAASTLSDRDLWQMTREVANYAGAYRGAESLALLLTGPGRATDVRALGWVTVANIRLGAGRPAAARAAIAEAALLHPDQAAQGRAIIAAVSPFEVPRVELAAARAGLAKWKNGFAPLGGKLDPAVVGGMPEIRRNMLETALRVRAGETRLTAADSVSDRYHRVNAIAAKAMRDSVTDPTVAREMLTGLTEYWLEAHNVSMAPTEGLVRLARARLLRIVGKKEEAVKWYSTFPTYNRDDFMYLATAALERGRLQRAMGDARGALRSFTEVAWLWQDAEPSVKATAPEAFPPRR